MITLVKINPVVVPVIFYDGTNIQDFIDMWGYDNIEGHNGDSFSIGFNNTYDGVIVPICSYVLNYLGTPIVLNKTQFLGLTDEYFKEGNEEYNYFFLTRDELIEKSFTSKRNEQSNINNKIIVESCKGD